jgi:putative membrane protein
VSARSFLEDKARSRAAAAVKAVEAQTSAEIVVAVRPRSADYRAACYRWGCLFSVAGMLYIYFAPKLFYAITIPLDLLLTFAIGFVTAYYVPPLQRLLTLPRDRRDRVATAARAAFYDLGVSGTTGRNGILVFVSLFERIVEVVPDLRVDPRGLGAGWTDALAAMQKAARRLDGDALWAALESLGPVLGRAMPRSSDDVNELPDEPR